MAREPQDRVVTLENGSFVIGYTDGAVEVQQQTSGKSFVIDKNGKITEHTMWKNMGGGRHCKRRCGVKLSKNSVKKCRNVIAKGCRYKRCHLHRK